MILVEIAPILQIVIAKFIKMESKIWSKRPLQSLKYDISQQCLYYNYFWLGSRLIDNRAFDVIS